MKSNRDPSACSTHICENMTTITAVEATSEVSFFSVVNERECARSSEWQRLNGQTSPLWFTKFTYNSTLCMFSTVNECGKREGGREGSAARPCVFSIAVYS